MRDKVGEVEALFRYPVKSMCGERLNSADLGWHGLTGDRRFAVRRVNDGSGFPWLTATKLPELILFSPQRRGTPPGGDLPTHVRTPDGEEFPTLSQELAADLGRRHGSPVELIHLRHGIFDDATISVITSATVTEIAKRAGVPADVRRFRPNVQIASLRSIPFEEDEWIGGVLSFGEKGGGGAISITVQDERCSMINLDPDSAQRAPEMLKSVVQTRDNKAGIYSTVIRRGRLEVGQPVFFERGD
jgi:uncharacterized protein YcbX